MTPETHQRAREIFVEVRALPLDARHEIVEAKCAGDADLRSLVDSLLVHDTDYPTADESTGAVDHPLIGKKIGPFKVKSVIASGGMGTVYQAMQEQPRRTVALKVMRAGIASRSALRRFEYESQILARLRHPGIAQVYEAGTHDDGGAVVPYFAMEYIPSARTLPEYATWQDLSTRGRIELFAKVCDAVHHGHQKGVIHRDLKPGNILVDTSGQPKIIDFGVARSTDSDLAVTTLQTDIGQLIGTLQYMSPEQCEADPNDIDTRSDVYALGVVLYELLTGRRPYDVSRSAISEAARIIKEEEPAHPSTINRTLRGDIETITLKALEKHRSRRYQSAAELAQDIRRYLANEPILARPPSVSYRVKKFVRRHTALTVGTAAVVVALAVGVIATSVMLQRAIAAEHLASQQRDEAEIARLESEAVTEFLAGMLASVDPSEMGRDVTVRAVLDEASRSIGDRFGSQPRVEGKLRTTIGTSYQALGEYDAAAPHLLLARERTESALGRDHALSLEAADALAGLYQAQGNFEEAETLHRRTLETRGRVFGEDHPVTAESMVGLAGFYMSRGRYDDAEPLFTRALEIRRASLGEEDQETLESMNLLGALYEEQARFDEAEQLLAETLTTTRRVMGGTHPNTLSAMVALAGLHVLQGRYGDAESMYVRVLEDRRRVLGEEHPGTIATMHSLATVYQYQERNDLAEPLLVEALRHQEETLGEEHPSTLNSMNNLAGMYIVQERYAEAEPLLVRTVEIRRRVIGKDHPSTLISESNLAKLLIDKGDPMQGEEVARSVVERGKAALGEDHWFVGNFLGKHGLALAALGRRAEAEAAMLEGYGILEGKLGAGHGQTQRVSGYLTEFYAEWEAEEPGGVGAERASAWRTRIATVTEDSQ